MITQDENGLTISLKIIPNSSRNEIVLEDSFIKVKLTAQPIENKANKVLVEYLSKEFKIPKTYITIIRGQTSKDKVLRFESDDKKKLQDIIDKLTK